MSWRGSAAILGVLALVVGMTWLYAGPHDASAVSSVIVTVVGLLALIAALTTKPPNDRG